MFSRRLARGATETTRAYAVAFRIVATTPFLYDFHSYHHVSSDYVRSLRRRFLTALDDSDARFLVRGKAGPPPAGPKTSREFPELDVLLSCDYDRVVERLGYDIYERRR